VEQTFHYANTAHVLLPPCRLPERAPLSQAVLAQALRELRTTEEEHGLWTWADVADLLPPEANLVTLRAVFMRSVGRDRSLSWPTYARVSAGWYRFLGEHEPIPSTLTCREEILRVIKESLIPMGRLPFAWYDVWNVLEAEGTLYSADSVRVEISEHLVGRSRSRPSKHTPVLRRVGRGLYEPLDDVFDDLVVEQPAMPGNTTWVRLVCAWCGNPFRREQRQVHPGPAYCCRSHQASATWAGARRRPQGLDAEVTHGAYKTYRRGCRCDECKAANTQRMRRYYEAKRQKDNP
jgi:hypothetical protein